MRRVARASAFLLAVVAGECWGAPLQLLHRVGNGIDMEASLSWDLQTSLSWDRIPGFSRAVVAKAPDYQPANLFYFPAGSYTGGVLTNEKDGFVGLHSFGGEANYLERIRWDGAAVWTRYTRETGALCIAKSADLLALLRPTGIDIVRASDGELTGSVNARSGVCSLSSDGSTLAYQDGLDLFFQKPANPFDRARYRYEGSLVGVSLSPDGHYAGVVSWHHTIDGQSSPYVAIFDVQAGRELFSVPCGWYQTEVPFASDGSRFAILLEYEVCLLDTLTGSNKAWYKPPKGLLPVRAFLSPDDQTLFVLGHADWRRGLVAYSVQSGKQLSLCSEGIGTSEFAPTRQALVARIDKRVCLVDQDSGKPVWEAVGGTESGPVGQYELSSFDSSRSVVVTANVAGQSEKRILLKTFDLASGRLLSETPVMTSQDSVESVIAVRPTGSEVALVVSTKGKTRIVIVDRLTGALKATFAVAAHSCHLRWSADSRWLLGWGIGGLFAADYGGSGSFRFLPSDGFRGQAISRDGQWIGGTVDGEPTDHEVIVRAADMAKVADWPMPEDARFAVDGAFSSDGNLLWVLCDNGEGTVSIRALNWRTGEVLYTDNTPAVYDGVRHLQFSDDGQTLLGETQNKDWVSVWSNPFAPDPATMPSSVELSYGLYKGGSVGSLYYLDADRLTLRGQDPKADGSMAAWVASGQAPVERPFSPSVSLRLACSKSGHRARVLAYDWAARRYVRLAEMDLGTTLSTYTVSLTQAGVFTRPGDGNVRLLVQLVAGQGSRVAADLVADRLVFNWH